MPTLEWGARRAPLCDRVHGDTPAEPSWNRRAAVLNLLAAAQTEDASERNRLRRQAAELIYPAGGLARPPSSPAPRSTEMDERLSAAR